MKWMPFALSSLLVLYALLLRMLIYFQKDVFALREWTTRYSWAVLLVFLILGVVGVLLRRHRLPCVLTVLMAIGGALLWYVWFSTFQTA